MREGHKNPQSHWHNAYEQRTTCETHAGQDASADLHEILFGNGRKLLPLVMNEGTLLADIFAGSAL